MLHNDFASKFVIIEDVLDQCICPPKFQLLLDNTNDSEVEQLYFILVQYVLQENSSWEIAILRVQVDVISWAVVISGLVFIATSGWVVERHSPTS